MFLHLVGVKTDKPNYNRICRDDNIYIYIGRRFVIHGQYTLAVLNSTCTKNRK